MKNFTLVFFLIVLCSCSITHNIPQNQTPNELIDNTYKVFVDQNGDFYPDNWEDTYGKHPRNAGSKKGAYSLNTLANTSEKKENLVSFRRELIQKIDSKFSNKKRIFILIHGYNNSESKAKEGFDAVKKQIKFNNKEDGIIEFYWDGLVANGPISSFKIWFYATGYSQLAGERGLRNILNSFKDKEIIIISHSRGASVVLSSLSNPPYKEKFANQTYKFHNIKVNAQPKLIDNNNNIKILMLAPAIGLIDFRTPQYYTTDKISYREFSKQVKKISITINKNDKVLKKYVKILSDDFNPTDLGYNREVYNTLKTNYEFMSDKDFNNLNSHSFIRYVNDTRFKDALNQLGVKTTK